jgi:hypothetical protein
VATMVARFWWSQTSKVYTAIFVVLEVITTWRVGRPPIVERSEECNVIA